MVIKIVPNIFALDKEVFDKKLEILKFAKHIHLDFMDGNFTSRNSVVLDDMKGIKDFPDKVFDLHMMAFRPADYVERIVDLGVRRVYVQFEVYCSDERLDEEIEVLKKRGLEVGIVLNPSTPVLSIVNFLKKIDGVMIMSVWPGEEGQKFMPETLSKVSELRELGFNKNISFDGGINKENVRILADHGVDMVFIGSAISSQDNAEKEYKEFCQLVK